MSLEATRIRWGIPLISWSLVWQLPFLLWLMSLPNRSDSFVASTLSVKKRARFQTAFKTLLIKRKLKLLTIYSPHAILQVHLKQLILWKRSIFFVTHFRKWNPCIIQIHYTWSEIFKAFISWNFDDYGLQIMKTQFSVSENYYII